MSTDAPSSDTTPLRIGLTGGIASGKSTVADMFAALDVPIIDTDLIAREIVEPGEPALDDIRHEFGDEVFDDKGGLDRRCDLLLALGRAAMPAALTLTG